MDTDCVFCEVQIDAIYIILINISPTSMISGFCREEDENCALLGYYKMSHGNFFTDVSGQPISPIFKGKKFLTLKDWTDRLSQNSRKNYHYSLYNNQENCS